MNVYEICQNMSKLLGFIVALFVFFRDWGVSPRPKEKKLMKIIKTSSGKRRGGGSTAGGSSVSGVFGVRM